MDVRPENMSGLMPKLPSPDETWQDLVVWDGELYDPLFQGDLGLAATSTENAYHDSFASTIAGPESVTSEQSYLPSTTTSLFEGSSSFDCAHSRPPSIAGDPSSFSHGHPWLNGSPSYTTIANSPLRVQVEVPYRTSFEAPETMLSPERMSATSPLDADAPFGAYQSALAPGLFNPHLTGSPYAFSRRDVAASRTLDTIGSWIEPSVETIMETHHEDGNLDFAMATPIPIRGSVSHRFTNAIPDSPRVEHASYRSPPSQVGAIAIPQPSLLNANVLQGEHSRLPLERRHSRKSQSQGSSRESSLLSVSPDQRRLPRSAPLARSLSNPRRSRHNKPSSPSPTSNTFGWVSYQPNTEQKLVPLGTEAGRGRRQRGRIGALTAQQRNHAALMRVIGSCSNCKKRKEKCDPETPCKSCLDHYKGDLVNHPCRDRLLSHLAGVFFTERLGWHPTARPIDSCAGNHQVKPVFSYSIPIIFGFGPALYVDVFPVQFEHAEPALYHQHIIYPWPPNALPGETHTHAVLPAVLTPQSASALEETLEKHLTLLVDKQFNSFPPFCSSLRILRHVYVLCRSLPTNSPYSRLLRQALKLLILVHVGGDITVLPDPNIDRILHSAGLDLGGITPTPCFIRSQIGSIMPSLALKLMREILLSLEQLFLRREDQEWPIAVATLLVILMTVESIQYHAAKLPYHHAQDMTKAPSQPRRDHDFQGDDYGVQQLLDFYSACYAGCHARLHPDWQGDGSILPQAANSKAERIAPEDKFIESIRNAIREATPAYLSAKATADRIEGDMSYYFDRLAARLLVLRTNDNAATSQNDAI